MKEWKCNDCGFHTDLDFDKCPECRGDDWVTVEAKQITGKDILAASKKRFKSDHCQAAFVKGARWYKQQLEKEEV